MGQFSSKNIGNPSQYDYMSDEEIHEELEKRRPKNYPSITAYQSAMLTERQLYARIRLLEKKQYDRSLQVKKDAVDNLKYPFNGDIPRYYYFGAYFEDLVDKTPARCVVLGGIVGLFIGKTKYYHYLSKRKLFKSIFIYGSLPTFIIIMPYTIFRQLSRNDDTNSIPLDVRIKNYMDEKYNILDKNEYRVATNRKIMSYKEYTTRLKELHVKELARVYPRERYVRTPYSPPLPDKPTDGIEVRLT